MLIGFDNTFADINQAGTGVYVRSLAKALSNNQSIVLRLFSAGQKRDINQPKTLRTRVDTLYRDLLWMHVILPTQAKIAKVDLLHLPANISPIKPPVPVVLTILDTILYRIPKNFPFWQRNYFQLFGPISAKRAAHIITISDTSKKDIIKTFQIKPNKVTSIPIAINDQFRLLGNKQEIQDRYGFGRFILTVGAVEPRKNLIRLIEAFHEVHGEIPGICLVHAGPRGWHMDHLSKLIEKKGLAHHIYFLGKVSLKVLVDLYNAAEVVAYPSLYEGFGLPVLEAMACGCPVVTSNISSMPEVTGNAAILVNPYNTHEISDAIINVLSNPNYAMEYRERGINRAKEFSWSRCAEETIKIYQRVLGL